MTAWMDFVFEPMGVFLKVSELPTSNVVMEDESTNQETSQEQLPGEKQRSHLRANQDGEGSKKTETDFLHSSVQEELSAWAEFADDLVESGTDASLRSRAYSASGSKK